MKKILVPTDFSDHAEYALKVAAQIARKNNGEIFLLHMLELPSLAADPINGGHEVPEIMFFMKKTHERFAEIKSASYLEGIEVTEAIQFEKAFEGIIGASKKHNIDLIVMGSHGASGFHEMFIGSNTEKVVRTSDVPVLVIKKEEGEFSPQQFVFASNFSDEIKNFAAGFNINAGFTKDIYNDVNVEKGVLHFANSVNADLIGMCTHGRQGIAHFFNGSISEDLVNHAVRPVVTFRI
jgi:nucleotide-binding universal stress UspA family protein